MEVLLKLHQAAILMYGGADGVLDEGTLHYLQGGVLLCQNSDKAKDKIDTKKELAKIAGVSHDTIVRVKKIEEKDRKGSPPS